MAMSLVQLLLLSCTIVMSASLSCNDVTCCTGEVCVEEALGRNDTIASCVAPTSCRQLQCPSGFECINSPGAARCQASCSGVQCPEYFRCVAQGSSTECVAVDDCSQIQCPQGTSCQTQDIEGRKAAVCIGRSCNNVDCFNGTECSDYSYLTFSGSASGSGSQEEIESVACLPTCEGTDVCPQGLVCEADDYTVTCREAVDCEELTCPMGQQCEEVTCGIQRSRRSIQTGKILRTRTAPSNNTLLVCVAGTSGSGSGGGGNEASGNGAFGDQAIGNQPSIVNSAESIVATKLGTLLSAVVALVPLTHVFFLFHL